MGGYQGIVVAERNGAFCIFEYGPDERRLYEKNVSCGQVLGGRRIIRKQWLDEPTNDRDQDSPEMRLFREGLASTAGLTSQSPQRPHPN
jgi:hypothetical protein